MIWNQYHSFRHGTHPPEEKDDTNHLPIRQFPFAPVMILPLLPRIGSPAIPIVREGEEVRRGQLIARADGLMSVSLHASATGRIKKIGLTPSISGKMVNGMYIEVSPGSTQEVDVGLPCLIDRTSPQDIINAIQEAGIVGLGGAAFPTHMKLQKRDTQFVDTLIINGVECEPYLTTDHRVMLEQAEDIFAGIAYLLKATGANRAIIGVEANKTDAAEYLRMKNTDQERMSVEVLSVKYPQGAEKLLISSLLAREVPSGGLPLDVNVVVVNVATCAEIGQLLPRGQGIYERVITISGPGVVKKGNYRIPIGTPLRFALDYVGVKDNVSEVFLGGPMMGQAVPNLDIPITKGTSGFVVFTENESTNNQKIFPCIHCGHCVDVCPMFLNPSQLGLLAKNEQIITMVQEYNLMDCFECGACSYVCPSHIPLVQYFRLAKSNHKKIDAA